MKDVPFWIQALFFIMGAVILYVSMMYSMSKKEIAELKDDKLNETSEEDFETIKMSSLGAFDKVFALADKHSSSIEYAKELQKDASSNIYRSTAMIVQNKDIDDDWIICNISRFKHLNLHEIDSITFLYIDGTISEFTNCD